VGKRFSFQQSAGSMVGVESVQIQRDMATGPELEFRSDWPLLSHLAYIVTMFRYERPDFDDFNGRPPQANN
jgi:hypothetical protein